MAKFQLDVLRSSKIPIFWDSYNSLGASVTPSALGTVVVYKMDGNTETSVGVSENSIGVDSRVGMNRITIDSSASAAFYAPGNIFHVHASGFTIDGQFVSHTVAAFSIEYAHKVGQTARSLASAGAPQAITIPGTSTLTVDYHQGEIVEIVDGPGAGQARLCTSYATSGVFTLDRAWAMEPTSASTVLRYSGSLPGTSGELAQTVWGSGSTATVGSVTTVQALTPSARSAIADNVLLRNVAGGSDSGRTVGSALFPLRNRVLVGASVGTVYQVDDSTSAWTFSHSTGAFPLSGVDPA